MKISVLAGAVAALALTLTGNVAEARRGGDPQQSRGTTGEFDYYLLTLSWSPEFCKTHPTDKVQCGPGLTKGFVVHGLWPQYNKGYPQYCVKPAPAVPQAAVDIAVKGNPSASLFTDHEWPKHGTCATTDPVKYAEDGLSGYQAFAVPARLQTHNAPGQMPLADFKALLLQANPTLSDGSLKVQCDRSGALQEIRICLDKGLKPQTCTDYVRDDCPSSLLIDPIP